MPLPSPNETFRTRHRCPCYFAGIKTHERSVVIKNTHFALTRTLERIAILEAAVFGSPQNPVHVAESVDVNDGTVTNNICLFVLFTFSVAAHITVQRCQGAITIAITSPIKPDAPDSDSFFNPVPSLTPTAPTPLPIPTAASTSPFRPDAPDSATSFFNPVPSPTLTPTAPTPMPIPTALPSTPIPSQNSISSSWGPMMTPGEVQELLASQPQVGEYYVVIKGRRPGVYLSW